MIHFSELLEKYMDLAIVLRNLDDYRLTAIRYGHDDLPRGCLDIMVQYRLIRKGLRRFSTPSGEALSQIIKKYPIARSLDPQSPSMDESDTTITLEPGLLMYAREYCGPVITEVTSFQGARERIIISTQPFGAIKIRAKQQYFPEKFGEQIEHTVL